MSRDFLTKEEIINLISLIREAFRNVAMMKEKDPLAQHIIFPRIPTILSESIVYHLVHEKKILRNSNITAVQFGGRSADLLGTTNKGVLKIEVKATGSHGFQAFSKKDISANHLIWIHFDDFFENSNSSIVEIFVINNPGSYFKQPRKIRLKEVKDLVGVNLETLWLGFQKSDFQVFLSQ